MFWCKTILILFCRKAAELKNLLSVRAGSMSDAALRLTDTASIILCLDMAGMLLSQPVNKVRTSTETETGKDNHFFLIFFFFFFLSVVVLYFSAEGQFFCFVFHMDLDVYPVEHVKELGVFCLHCSTIDSAISHAIHTALCLLSPLSCLLNKIGWYDTLIEKVMGCWLCFYYNF